jgi:hypothetical protein
VTPRRRTRPASPTPGRTFFGSDHYALAALGEAEEIGGSFSDLDIFVGARGFSESVIPGIDEELLGVDGAEPASRAAVEEILLGRFSNRDLWSQPSLPMELRGYVSQLIERGRLFIRLHFAEGEGGTIELMKTSWLAPETIVHRPHAHIYEQYASRKALMQPGVVVEGEPREHLFSIPESEVLALHWPLPEPGSSSPAAAARALGREVGRQAGRVLLSSRAQAEPQESYLPLARARSGAFRDALEAQQLVSAQIKDALFYPGAYEAEAYPWVKEATDYFRADRILRSRIAICQVRTYLFDELNSQLMDRWTKLNNWAPLRLGLRPHLFEEADWIRLHSELAAGELGLEDVRAAVAVEAEVGFEVGRRGRAENIAT